MKTREQKTLTREQKALKNIKYACDCLTGTLENMIDDYPEESEEYKGACDMLYDHEKLVNQLYDMVTSNIYDRGTYFYGGAKYIRDINLLGKKWLIEKCEEQLNKEGY